MNINRWYSTDVCDEVIEFTNSIVSGSHYIFLRTWHQRLTTETKCPLKVCPPLFKSKALTMFSYERGFYEFRHFNAVLWKINTAVFTNPLTRIELSAFWSRLLSQLSTPPLPPQPPHQVKSVKKCDQKTLVKNQRFKVLVYFIGCVYKTTTL